MQKMTRSPATPGLIGRQSYRSPELVTCARRLSKATTAAAVELAGQKMFMKSNIKSTESSAKNLHAVASEISQAYKPSSTETQEPRPQAKGSSFKPESTSSRIREPG